MTLLAIDPGPVESAWVEYDAQTRLPVAWAKKPNEAVLAFIAHPANQLTIDELAIEMVASYGMPVGADVFETCVWAGRFIERWHSHHYATPQRVFRREVKLHLCGSARAKDANIRQALIDRYGPGKEAAVGRKQTPGPLYGLTGDCWAALAVAVTVADTRSAARAAA